LSRFDGFSWTTFTSFEMMSFDTVFAIAEDRTGNLWFGTDEGLARSSASGFEVVSAITGPVLSLFEDAEGRMWAGTRLKGVYRNDGAGWANFSTDSGLVSDNVRAIVQASDGVMWFGTRDGVRRFDGATWTTYRVQNGLASNLVLAAARDSSGVLWFGTEG